MSARFFASDNASGVHPRVLEAIAAANDGHALGYGDDPWTLRAAELLRAAFGRDCEVLLTFGGTGANVVGLAALTRPYDAVLCADSAHLWNSECAAPERFLGGKLVPVPAIDGKLSPALLAPELEPTRGVHHTRARVVSISQPTEWGTLYTVDELRALADYVHARNMALHVDGARLANAAAALDLSLAQSAPDCGVDVLSFGGTKNGLMGAEAVLIFDRALATEAAYARKQATQLASKMRFLAAQFIAYMEDELWRALARHANAMAGRLATAVEGVPGLRFVCPVECNMLFPSLPAAAIAALRREHEFYLWNERRSIARWLTSFDTTTEDVDRFAAAVRAACAAAERPRT